MGQSNCGTGKKPKKWRTLTLGDCATLVRRTVLPSEAGDIPYIGLEHIRKGGMRLLGYGKASNVTSMKTRFQAGDILFGKLRPYFCKVVIASFEGICSTDIWVLRAKRGVDERFLFYLMASRSFIDFATSSSGGTRMPRAKWDYVSKYEIQLPPLFEQRRIAKILSTWGRAIETIEKLISNTQAQKEALKWQLLKGRRRFMTNKGEWKVVSFGDVMDMKTGGTPSRNNPAYWDHEKNTENRWVSISDLQSPSIEETKEHLSDLGVKNSNAKLIPAGSIVMSFKLTIGRTAVLGKACYTNEAVCAILPKDEKLLLKDYLLQALPYVNYEKEIDQAVKGKTLNKKKLRNLKLALPPYEEQRRIADVLSALDSKESILISSRAKLELEKVELMRVLLTGKRRIRVDDDSND